MKFSSALPIIVTFLGLTVHHFLIKPRDASAISVTAHFTGYTWYANDLSHPALATAEGQFMHMMARPLNSFSKYIGLPTLEGFLLGRHATIDDILTKAIEKGEISQIVEVAAGLSPRGWSFKQKYGNKLTYIEADLPAMAKRKRDILTSANLISQGHEVVELDVFDASSCENVFNRLDKTKGVAIVTEGLVNYFSTDDMEGVWPRFASILKAFSNGIYVSDLHLEYMGGDQQSEGFKRFLTAVVRGDVYLHYKTDEEAIQKLTKFGFQGGVQLHDPSKYLESYSRGAEKVRVIHAVSH
jgi:O-methyltransferase involved in polyketide biosynthesis